MASHTAIACECVWVLPLVVANAPEATQDSAPKRTKEPPLWRVSSTQIKDKGANSPLAAARQDRIERARMNAAHGPLKRTSLGGLTAARARKARQICASADGAVPSFDGVCDRK